MKHLNESWSHIISSTKVHSQNIQVSFCHIQLFRGNIRLHLISYYQEN